MKTLEQIKDEVAAKLKMRDFQGNLITDWETFHSIYGIHQNTLELVCKRYATECIKASLEKAAENGRNITNEAGYNMEIDKSSITSKENIVLL